MKVGKRVGQVKNHINCSCMICKSGKDPIEFYERIFKNIQKKMEMDDTKSNMSLPELLKEELFDQDPTETETEERIMEDIRKEHTIQEQKMEITKKEKKQLANESLVCPSCKYTALTRKDYGHHFISTRHKQSKWQEYSF
jgi:hypothetical protein